MIEERFSDLLQRCGKIAKSEQDWDLIKKAFFLAKEAHRGVRRRSGEPYIIHPIAVAKIVIDEVGLGVKSVVASLLHDVVEDTAYTTEDIAVQFGPKISVMVDGLTKMASVFNHDTSQQAEYFRKVLLTLSDDVRVILIKIADRLHNMRTLEAMPFHKQVKIAGETLYLFAPLAYRLGLYAIKSELEDLSLKYLFPEQYLEIERKLNETEAQRALYISKFNDPIIDSLTENGINFEISGRVKSIYSIWSKMQRKQISFEEIYDLFAIRIVFKPTALIQEKAQCWNIYSLIADIYTLKPDRMRNWVYMPKANGYEALHATVMGPGGVWVEIQIRSERMEEIAERGFAAHWHYKQAAIGEEGEFDRWIKQIREALGGPTENAVEFLDNFKMTLYTSEVMAFTPKGEARKFPKGATALDFAYDIHTKIGNRAIGAKINHKIESIFTPIASGDQIEIITSSNAHPVAKWLEHVATPKARQGIKTYLRKENENNIERGIEIFESTLRGFGITPSARVFRKVLPAYQSSSKDEFYSNLGAGIINLENLEKVLKENASKKMLKFWTFQVQNTFKLRSEETKKKHIVRDHGVEHALDALQFLTGECCHPIPGDPIIGHKDLNSGKLYIHKTSCGEVIRLASQDGDNIVPVEWSSHKVMSYLSVLEIRGIDRKGILLALAQVITGEMKINIRGLQIQSHDGIFEGTISLYVENIEDVSAIISKVGKIKGVERIRRIENT